MRRTLVTVAITLVIVISSAPPASAHTVSGVGATNHVTTLSGVTPAVAGVVVRVIEKGSRLELTNTTATDAVVIGYQDEPYLRVGPQGVFENTRSPATYLNRTRAGSTTPPVDADPTAPPVWRQVSSGHTARWHDHRIHWMGGVLPPQVQRDPGHYHQLDSWKVTVQYGSQTLSIDGSRGWQPGPSAWPWWLGAAVVLIGVAAMGRSPRWATLVAAMASVLVVSDAVHAVGIAFAGAGSNFHRVVTILTGSYYSIVAWLLGIVALALLRRRSVDGLFAAIFSGLVIGLFGGLTDVGAFNHSQVPFAFGAELDRVLIMLAIGVGLGVVIASVVAFQLNRPLYDAEGDDAANAPVEADLGANADTESLRHDPPPATA